jgi:hypothetical protein
MQQFREKFLLLSHYLHDVFGAGFGEDVTTVKDVCGSNFITVFFKASVRKWTRSVLRRQPRRGS